MSEGEAGRNVLETLNSEPPERFVLTFVDNLAAVFEYDAKEIQDFLLSLKTDSDAQHKDILFRLRQALHDKLCESFPDIYNVNSMYNRRKNDALARDIYVIGYSVISNMEDRRLKTVYKNLNGNPSDMSVPIIDESLLSEESDTANITAVCIQLKVSVMQLTNTVNRLQDDINSLTEQLEAQQNHCVTCESRLSNNPITISAPDENTSNTGQLEQPGQNVNQETPTLAHEEGNQTTEDAQTDVQEGNQLASATPLATAPAENTQNNVQDVSQVASTTAPEERNRTVNGSDRPGTTETRNPGGGDQGFALPQHQRKQAKQGRLFTEVHGSATRTLTISGVANQTQTTTRPRSVYIGKLSDSTTPITLRQHPREVGAHDITDVIDLKCKIPGRSSFCVIVDSQQSEDVLYNANNWPLGAKVRPYKEKKQIDHQNRANRIGPRFNRDRKNTAPRFAVNAPSPTDKSVSPTPHVPAPPVTMNHVSQIAERSQCSHGGTKTLAPRLPSPTAEWAYLTVLSPHLHGTVQ